MEHNYSYAFGTIILKPLIEDDIESLRILRNKNRQYFCHTEKISAEAQRAWYNSYLNKTDDIMFKVVKKELEGKFIGAVALYDIDEVRKTAEFGRVVIDKSEAPEKGIGTETVKAICLFSFTVLKLESIKATVLENNAKAIAIYKRVGFRVVRSFRAGVLEMILTKESLII